MRKILIIDDDLNQMDHLEKMLNSTFSIHKSETPMSAWESLTKSHFDALIVDAHMPIINGFEFIEKIQQSCQSKKPAIFVMSSDTSMPNKLQALKLGVNDFLWPEMNQEEIILRIKNSIGLNNESELTHSYKTLKVDVANLAAYQNGSLLELTHIEFKLLTYMTAHVSKVVKRSDLKEFIWPETVVMDKTLNTHLTNLRMKLKDSGVDLKSVKNEGIILS